MYIPPKRKPMDTKKWKEVDTFLQRCFERFGSMNKNDYEVELMYLYLNNEGKDKSDHFISTYLKMPISKVKRLRYEVDLQHPKDKDLYKNEFYTIVTTKTFKIDNQGNILIAVNNKALREYLSELIEEKGSFFDCNFTGNIIKLTPADLVLLIADFEDKTEIAKRATKCIATNSKGLPQDGLAEITSFLQAVFKDAVGAFAPNVVNYLYNHFKKL